VVTASRIEEPLEEVANSITVLRAKELKQRGITTIIEALKEVEGVQLRQTGSFGGPTSIFIRGGNYGQATIMIDNVPLYDAMGVYRGDFGAFLPHLSIEQIERIEIVRGPQSVLYGSSAMTGVINIITKKGKGKPSISVFSEGGSYSSFREGLELSGGDKGFNYVLNYLRFDTNGISKATSYQERDSYHLDNLFLKIEGKVKEKITMGGTITYNDADTELDYYFDPNTSKYIIDAPDYRQKSKLLGTKTYFNHKIFPFWQQKVLFSYTKTDRDYKKDGRRKDYYDGKLYYTSWQHELKFKPITLIAGFDYQKEVGASKEFKKKRQDEKAWFLETIFKKQGLYLSAGMRYNRHQTAGDRLTYKVAAAYHLFPSTKLHSSFGTGFRAPTIYQLFDPTYGNKALKPEKNQGYDFGITQSFLNKKIEADITYFFNWFEDLISFYAQTQELILGRYQNITTAHTEGIEFSLNITPVSWFKILTNYSWLDAKDTTTNTYLPRMSKHKGSVTLAFFKKDKATLSLTGTYFGKHFDSEYNKNHLGGYFSLNLASRYQISSHLIISLRFQNLLDRQYEEIKGYSGYPFMAFLGAKIKW
jgi:vitamin B12 transporter